ncbi:MAG: hypothetical protein LBI42_02165 [Chitinispirillales bacterium]|jgi:hypothetical protein|nr:hypothetical protein [Chitinispirillales bacterium]
MKHLFLPLVPYISALIFSAFSVSYGQFRETRQLTNNNIIALAGNGDTVWIATERGLNYQTSLDDKKEWLGFEADNFKNNFYGLAFGGGGAVVLVYEWSPSNSFSFWHFDHKSGKQQQSRLSFSADMRRDTLVEAEPVGGLIYFDSKFWAPFKDGGMICYDPKDNSVTALRPGETATSPNNLSLPVNKSETSVLAIAGMNNGSGILVTTRSKIWAYTLEDKKWDDLNIDKTFDSGDEFVSFNAAFYLNKGSDASYSGYSFITTKNSGKEQTGLYRFKGDFQIELSGGAWFKALKNTPYAVFPSVNGRFYALLENNQVCLFADTLPGSSELKSLLEEKLTAYQFRTLLASAGDNPDPVVNDILFLPRTDSTGTLLVATSSGLYFSKPANPVTGDYPNMTHVNYIREVKSGESYALPGIIRGSSDGRYDKAVFVYRLKRDGSVTIRVYDYNMNHVKTIVNGAKRQAHATSGRSTVPSADFWNGTNKGGKRVSPGVYYYKITSTGGDRFFGKVVLAK